MEIVFSKDELARYNRHIIIPEFNLDGQKRLKAARVLVIGTGGLGSPLLMYLAAAGIGKIGLVDFDVVEESNLHRQVLFGAEDIGLPKVECAKSRLLQLNPHIEIETYNVRFEAANAMDIVKNYDMVADGTDNFPTRYLVNDVCVLTGKPNIYASIFQFEGQVSVFNHTYSDGTKGPNYRDLYAAPPPPGLVPSCAEGGVLGVLPGIIGSMQALEVIKVASGVGVPLAGKLFLFDALSFQIRILNIDKDPKNPISGENPMISELIDYEDFCGIKQLKPDTNMMKEITVLELKKLKDSGVDFQLIDVREPYEYEIVHIAGELIPLSTIPDAIDRIRKDVQVIVHCRSGARSAQAIRFLEDSFKMENLYNLKGGVLAYADEVDKTLAKY